MFTCSIDHHMAIFIDEKKIKKLWCIWFLGLYLGSIKMFTSLQNIYIIYECMLLFLIFPQF